MLPRNLRSRRTRAKARTAQPNALTQSSNSGQPMCYKTGQFYLLPTGNEKATIPQEARALVKRSNASVFPRMARVASMGGDTVPPQTARRMGCASFPREMPFPAAKLVINS